MKKFIILFAAILIHSCASIGNLSGGKKDELSPNIVKTNLHRNNFNEKRIILKFDEYIQLNEPSKNINIYPKHTTIKSEVIGKSLVITLDSGLQNNTTYELNINKGIKDNNEGILFNFNYLFSTGKDIDSGKIKFSYKNLAEYKNIHINLYSTQPDSFNFNKIEYQLKLTNDGENTIQGLKTNELYNYYIFAEDEKQHKILLNSIYNFDTISEGQEIIVPHQLIIDTTTKTNLDSNYIIYKKSDFNPLIFKDKRQLLYTDKDSTIFLNENFSSNDIKKLVKKYLEQNIAVYKEKIGFNYTINNNFNKIVLNGFKTNLKTQLYTTYFSENKKDTINITFLDSLNFNIILSPNNYKKINSEILIKNEEFKNLFVLIYSKNKLIISKVIKEKEINIILDDGEYLLEIYDLSNFHKNLLINPLQYKKIVIKPNWIEEIIIKK